MPRSTPDTHEGVVAESGGELTRHTETEMSMPEPLDEVVVRLVFLKADAKRAAFLILSLFSL